jgi:hypothetical protein
MANTDFRNIDALLSQFDVMATPFIEVYEGKQKKFDYIEDDIDGSRDFLKNQLEAIKFFGNTALFRIAFYRQLTDSGKLTPDNLKGSNTFKLMEYEEASDTPYWQQKRLGGSSSELTEIKEMLLAQQSQINALLQEPDEEEEKEKVSGFNGFLGAVMPFLQNPDVQKAIAAKIIGFINKIIPDPSGKTMYMNENPQLAGYTEEEANKINESLITLMSAGMTVNDFEKLAALTKEPKQFRAYLLMLRG